MGALIAGISLSTFPYNLDVMAKAVSIRDFFVTLFFVALGMQIPVPTLRIVLLALAASAFLVLSRLVVVPPILYALRLGHRTSLIPAINLAQVSEFSIVIASLGLVRQQIGPDVVTIVIITFAITSVVSTYMINRQPRGPAGAGAGSQADRGTRPRRPGRGRRGKSRRRPTRWSSSASSGTRARSSTSSARVPARRARGRDFLSQVLVIDFNPRVIQELRRRGVACSYGDIAHIDTLHHAGIEQARLIVCSITDDILRGTTNLRMMRNIRRLNPEAKIVVTSEHIKQATELYEAGADFVYVPRLHSAAEMAAIIKKSLRSGFPSNPVDAMALLRSRHEVLD